LKNGAFLYHPAIKHCNGKYEHPPFLDDFPIQTSISTGFPSHVNFPSTTSGNVWVSRRGLVSDDEVNELRREADGEEP